MKVLNFTLLFATSLLIIGCKGSSEAEIEDSRIEMFENFLPPNVTNIEPLDEDWCYFDLDGRTFLFYETGGKGRGAITEITPEKPEDIILHTNPTTEESEENDGNYTEGYNYN